MELKNKLQWISDLRVISTLCVIIIHISCRVFDGTIGSSLWWVGNIFDSSARFAVPIFVMISGVLLLPKEYNLNEFFKNKTLRIILPFLFWILFYILFYLFREIHNGSSVDIHYAFNFILSNLYTIPIFAYHFWYIYMLIGLYLFIPIIGKWIRNASEREIEYFLILWIITIILAATSFGSKLIDNLNINYFSGYLGYLVLGYYLSRKELKWKKKNIQFLSLLFILLGAFSTIYGTWFLSFNKGSYDTNLHNYLSPNVLVLTIGVFIFVKNIELTHSNLSKIIYNFIDKYSYGIYLVHVFVLECLLKLKIDLNFWSRQGKFPIFGIIVTSMLCILISCILLYVVNVLPYGKYISGVSNQERKISIKVTNELN